MTTGYFSVTTAIALALGGIGAFLLAVAIALGGYGRPNNSTNGTGYAGAPPTGDVEYPVDTAAP